MLSSPFRVLLTMVIALLALAPSVHAELLYQYVNNPADSSGTVPADWDVGVAIGGPEISWAIDVNVDRRFSRYAGNGSGVGGHTWTTSQAVHLGTLLDSSSSADLTNYSVLTEYTKSTNAEIRTMLRHDGASSNENYYEVRLEGDNQENVLQIYEVAAGVPTLLASSDNLSTAVRSGGYFEVSIVGDTITANAYSRSSSTREQGPLEGSLSFNVDEAPLSQGTFGYKADWENGGVALWSIEVNNPDLLGTIDRTDGRLVLENTSSSSIEIVGYSFTSDEGALDNSGWTSIADYYDVDGPNGTMIGSVDDNDQWAKLTGSGVFTDLSEFESSGGDGATLTTGQSIELGNVWLKHVVEDVNMQVLLATGEILSLPVVYENGPAGGYEFGDLNFDGVFDIDDFRDEFVGAFLMDTTLLSPAQQYQAGDFDNNGVVDKFDFFALNDAYLAANPGAPALSFAEAVPEPGSLFLLLIGFCAVTTGWRLRPSKIMASALVVTILTLPGFAEAQLLYEYVNNPADTAGTVPAGWDVGVAVGGPEISWAIDGNVDRRFSRYAGNGSGVGGHTWTTSQAVHLGTLLDSSSSADLTNYSVLTEYTKSASAEVRTMLRHDGTSSNENYYEVRLEGDDINNVLEIYEVSGGVPTLLASSGALPTAVRTSGYFEASVLGDTITASAYSRAGEHVQGTLQGSLSHTIAGVPISQGAFGYKADWENGAVALWSIEVDETRYPMTLQVNKTTGAMALLNESFGTTEIDFYEIASPGGALDPNAWTSLEDQEYDGSPGNPAWDELGHSANNLSEGSFGSSTQFADSEHVLLGDAYTGSVAEDLVFEIRLMPEAQVSAGEIVYLEQQILGDMDGNGELNDNDISLFVLALTNRAAYEQLYPVLDADEIGDMNQDSSFNLGDIGEFKAAITSGPAGATDAVPEPTTGVLFLLGIAGVVTTVRRRS